MSHMNDCYIGNNLNTRRPATSGADRALRLGDGAQRPSALYIYIYIYVLYIYIYIYI